MEDGTTLKDHLMSGWRQKGYAEQYKPEELDIPIAPPETVRAWDYFQELHQRRIWGDHGPRLIGWGDIQAWQITSQSRLQPWEIDAILRLDKTFVEVWFEQNK